MLSPWAMLRSLFARVGSDPYYSSYERSLGNIKAEVDRLQTTRAARAKAWAAIRARFLGTFAAAYAAVLAYAAYVNRQPPGSYTASQQASRVAPAFLAPLGGWLAFRLLGWLQAFLDLRAARRVKQLEGKLRKQVAELKDSTRYQRTLELLQKYDPDYAPPKPSRTPSARMPGGPAPVSRAAGAAANMAGSALQGASAFMLPALGQLYSRAASTLIADDPVMVALLQQAQQQEQVLGQRLKHAEGHVVALLQDNVGLKQRLGLPTEDEERALAAWRAQAAGAPLAPGCGAAAEGAGVVVAAPAHPTEQQEEEEEEEEGEAAACTPEPASAAGDSGVGSGSSAGRISRRKRGGGGSS